MRRINKSNYFKNTKATFKAIDKNLAKKLLEFFLKTRANDSIEINGVEYIKDFKSVKKNAYFRSRGFSFYLITKDEKSLIRISDHWAGSDYERKESRKFNLYILAECFWSVSGRERFDYRFNGEKYDSRMIAGICDFEDFK